MWTGSQDESIQPQPQPDDAQLPRINKSIDVEELDRSTDGKGHSDKATKNRRLGSTKDDLVAGENDATVRDTAEEAAPNDTSMSDDLAKFKSPSLPSEPFIGSGYDNIIRMSLDKAGVEQDEKDPALGSRDPNFSIAIEQLDESQQAIRHRIIDLSQHFRDVREQGSAIKALEAYIEDRMTYIYKTRDLRAGDELRIAMASLRKHREQQNKHKVMCEQLVEALLHDGSELSESVQQVIQLYRASTSSLAEIEQGLPETSLNSQANVSELVGYQAEPVLSPRAQARILLDGEYARELERLENCQEELAYLQSTKENFKRFETSDPVANAELEAQIGGVALDISNLEGILKDMEKRLDELHTSYQSTTSEPNTYPTPTTENSPEPAFESVQDLAAPPQSLDSSDIPTLILFPTDETSILPTSFKDWSLQQGDDLDSFGFVNSWLLSNLQQSAREQEIYFAFLDQRTASLDRAELAHHITAQWNHNRFRHQSKHSSAPSSSSNHRSLKTNKDETPSNTPHSSSHRGGTHVASSVRVNVGVTPSASTILPPRLRRRSEAQTRDVLSTSVSVGNTRYPSSILPSRSKSKSEAQIQDTSSAHVSVSNVQPASTISPPRPKSRSEERVEEQAPTSSRSWVFWRRGFSKPP